MSTISLFSNNAIRTLSHLTVPKMPMAFFSTSSKISRFSESQFKELAQYAHGFLKDNSHQISCQKNESGFVRINVPMAPSMQSKFKDISKIRLNFWSPESGASIVPESIHTHPGYFESLIVRGGYSHEVFEIGQRNDEKYDLYRLYKEIGNKSFAYIDQVHLKSIKEESVKQGDIVVFPLDLIHRVLQTSPKTLSLNIIWKDEPHSIQNSYDVFLTKNGSLSDIKTQREVVTRIKSRMLVGEIMEHLSTVTK